MNKKSKKAFRFFFGLYFLVAVILLTLPGEKIGMLNIDDKILHIVGFSGLAFFAINALKKPTLGICLIIIISGTVFGGSTELMQETIVGRTASIYDVLANGVGMVIGSIASVQFLLFVNRRKPVSKQLSQIAGSR